LDLLENTPYHEDEVLVSIRPNAPAGLGRELANAYRAQLRDLGVLRLIGARVLHLTLPQDQTVEDVLPIMARDSRILRAQPNYIYDLARSGDRQSQSQYALGALSIPDTGDFPSGTGVRIAIIDTCLDARHRELQGAVDSFFDAMPSGGNQCVPEKHGTAIGGIIGGRDALRGVAPNAKLISARAFGKDNESGEVEGTSEAVLRSLNWAFEQQARIANMSFAGPRDPLIESAVTAAHKKGMILIASVGNAGPSSEPLYPAAYPEVIGVTAVDARRKLYHAANRGSHIAVAAPGVDMIVARPNNTYDVDSGTSLAAATVSGVAAIMLEKRPNATPDQIREALQSTAVNRDGQGKDNQFGFGFVYAKAAASFIESKIAP
jgi:subtilisin family serine protease